MPARDQTVCLPVKNRDGYYHACFFTRTSGCKTEGKGVCMQGTYVRTYVYREDPRRWIAALLNCLNGYRTDSIAATREPALISMGIVNPLGGGIYYFQVSFGQIDSIIIWNVYFLFLHILIRWRIFSDIIYLWRFDLNHFKKIFNFKLSNFFVFTN